MPTAKPTPARVLSAVLAAVAIVLAIGVPAAAQPEAKNPEVGGGVLDRSGVVIDGDAGPLPTGGIKSFLIADLDSGEVLASQNAHQQLPAASTLKMLTALTVLPRLDLDSLYTAIEEDAEVEGSKVGIVPGSTYTVRQLLEGMFLISGNDAASALANHNGGTATTIKQMQAEAWRVQAYDTVPRTPSGLDAPGQVSTAYDLALIARAGLLRKDFAQFAALTNSTFPVEGKDDPTRRATFEIWNQNDLVNGGYEGAIGVKSGFTTQAGRTFAAAAERGGKRYLVTMLGIEGQTYLTGAAYLDWAFKNAAELQPVGQLPDPKYQISQTDGAQVLSDSPPPAAPVSPVSQSDSAPTSHRASDGPGLFAGPASALLAITAVSCLLLWWGLRRQRRRAFRMRNLSDRSASEQRMPLTAGARRI